MDERADPRVIRLRHTRVDAQRNRLALVEAAARVFASDPQAPVSAVADAAGLHRATLHRHFTTADDLRSAVRERATGHAADAVRATIEATAGRPLDTLVWTTARLLSLGSRYRLYRFIPTVQLPASAPDVVNPIVAVVEHGQADGTLRDDCTARWLTQALMSMVAAALPELVANELTLGQATRNACTLLLNPNAPDHLAGTLHARLSAAAKDLDAGATAPATA